MRGEHCFIFLQKHYYYFKHYDTTGYMLFTNDKHIYCNVNSQIFSPFNYILLNYSVVIDTTVKNHQNSGFNSITTRKFHMLFCIYFSFLIRRCVDRFITHAHY